jgi:uncharacterized protein YdeI (YjbR/CyaY-like superfamily)
MLTGPDLVPSIVKLQAVKTEGLSRRTVSSRCRRGAGDKLGGVPDDLPELTVADAGAWREWLGEHFADPGGVWLVLAKKGTNSPTSLSYDQALDEAICHGWIDGQVGRRDEATYRQRFTPRRRRSAWSKSNVARVERLAGSGRMHPAGAAEVDRARADGRFEAAYEGQAKIEVPDDLATALAADPQARAMFATLTSQNRYAVLYRIATARLAETRSRRIEQFVKMLARGETPHPQKRSPQPAPGGANRRPTRPPAQKRGSTTPNS